MSSIGKTWVVINQQQLDNLGDTTVLRIDVNAVNGLDVGGVGFSEEGGTIVIENTQANRDLFAIGTQVDTILAKQS